MTEFAAPTEMTIKIITAAMTYPMRHSILRPNQSPQESVYPGDEDESTLHLGAFQEGELVGILSTYKEDSARFEESAGWRFRGMATLPEVRGNGYAAQLLSAAENWVAEKQGGYLWANARLNALGFYRKCGYQTYGDIFELPEIGPHYVIKKSLA